MNDNKRLEIGLARFGGIIWAIAEECVGEAINVLTDAERFDVSMLGAVRSGETDNPYLHVGDNRSVVSIHGILTRRWLGPGVANTDLVHEAVATALTARPKEILLDIDSPGGDVSGIAAVSNLVHSARSNKRRVVAAHTRGMMASAAYEIGSQADVVGATDDSHVGSIGVVARIFDVSRMLKNFGVDEFVYRSGPLKAIGAGPVTEEQKAVIREIADHHFEAFQARVTRTRGELDQQVLSGRLFNASMAAEHGLIDVVGSQAGLLPQDDDGE